MDCISSVAMLIQVILHPLNTDAAAVDVVTAQDDSERVCKWYAFVFQFTFIGTCPQVRAGKKQRGRVQERRRKGSEYEAREGDKQGGPTVI